MKLVTFSMKQSNVMIGVLKAIHSGDALLTPSGRSSFIINRLDESGVEVKIGKSGSTIFIPANCFEQTAEFLKSKRWVRVGALHEKEMRPVDTLDRFVKRYTHGTSAASYVAPILEKAGTAQLDRGRPNKISLLRSSRASQNGKVYEEDELRQEKAKVNC